MSRPEPKYSEGELVLIRIKDEPSLNFNYAKVVDVMNLKVGEEFRMKGEIFSARKDVILYLLEADSDRLCREEELRPIPKKQQSGIDAYEFIKRYTGEIE